MGLLQTGLRPALAAAVIVGLVFAGSQFYDYYLKPPTSSSPSMAKGPAKVAVELPVQLSIPAIGVKAGLDYVGVAANDELGVPKNSDNVGWYVDGPRPGQAGSAVIDGHYGWDNNHPAVFDKLGQLHKGDQLYIEDQKGGIITFVVSRLQILDQNEDASGVFKSSDGRSHLNLITCQGVWNPALRGYPNRLIVYADKE